MILDKREYEVGRNIMMKEVFVHLVKMMKGVMSAL